MPAKQITRRAAATWMVAICHCKHFGQEVIGSATRDTCYTSMLEPCAFNGTITGMSQGCRSIIAYPHLRSALTPPPALRSKHRVRAYCQGAIPCLQKQKSLVNQLRCVTGHLICNNVCGAEELQLQVTGWLLATTSLDIKGPWRVRHGFMSTGS